MPINSDGKVAYIYKDGTWYAISGAINTNASYTWTASQTFASPVTFEEVLISRAGINNFQSPETRDIAIPNPINGSVCFVRQSTTGGTLINQLQYYDNGWKNISGYSNVVSKLGSYSIDLNDAGKVITVDSSSPSTIALPTNAELPIANGFKFDVVRLGTGTVVISSSATVLSKNPSAAYIDSQYGRVTVIKLDTNTWLVTGDVYEGSTPAPAPVAPAPVAPAPVAPAPAPVAPSPVAPSPVAPSPVAPSPVAPVAPSPVAPSPVAPSPVAPSPAPAPAPAPAPVGVTNYFGYCDLTNSPNGPFATSSSCADAYAAQENANGYPPIGWVCGSTPLEGTPNCSVTPAPAPAPVAPSPAPAPVAPVSSSCVPADAWSYNKSMCQACGYYYSDTFGECSTTPWETSPSPAPVTPVAATAWYCKTEVQGGGCSLTGPFASDQSASGTGYVTICTQATSNPYTCPSSPAPSPAPAPVAPSPVAPSPAPAPAPAAPSPAPAPAPAAPAPAPVTTWYCSTTEYGAGQYRGTASSDLTGSICNDYATVCSTSGYPAYPTIPSCTPAPAAPVAPSPAAPVAPSPAAPVAPSPAAPVAPSPAAPVAPSPAAPVAPSPAAPVAPSPAAPVAPSPAAPVAPTGGGGCTCGYCWRCSICCPGGQQCAC
jgi:hypothetical protein